MQQPHDDGHDDAQLRNLLREWQAPETPPALERRVLGPRRRSPWYKSPWYKSVWRFLLSGYIRVPVPVACGVAVLLTVAMWRVSVRPPAPCVAEKILAPASRAARTLPPGRCTHLVPGAC